MFARVTAIFVVFLALAACATAPAVRGGVASLSVCSGSVSNAPAVDGRGRVIGFQPFANVRNVSLARAPVAACISSGYGPRRGAGGAGPYHNGVDLYTREPAPVAAAGEGVVSFAGRQSGYGNVVLIRHRNGVETRYAHLSSFAPHIRTGRRVSQGEIIGRTGRTGNATAVHLHYEVLIDGRSRNPLTVGR